MPCLWGQVIALTTYWQRQENYWKHVRLKCGVYEMWSRQESRAETLALLCSPLKPVCATVLLDACQWSSQRFQVTNNPAVWEALTVEIDQLTTLKGVQTSIGCSARRQGSWCCLRKIAFQSESWWAQLSSWVSSLCATAKETVLHHHLPMQGLSKC